MNQLMVFTTNKEHMQNQDNPKELFYTAQPIKVELLPTKIWIESDLLGRKHVMMQHQGMNNAFTYCTFNYDYAYTSNSGQREAATKLAVMLGATEPVEHKHRDSTFYFDEG